MKKCPNCHKKVSPNDQYCPHCGQNLKSSMQLVKWARIMFLLSFFIVPIFYYFLLDDNFMSQPSWLDKGQYELKEIKKDTIQNIIYQFDSIEEFDKKVKDVSSYITKIHTYEDQLQERLGSDLKKSYDITLFDNQDISFVLKYQMKIDNYSTFTVCKQFTRSESVEREEYYYTQKNIKTLSDIQLDNKIMRSTINDDTRINQLYKQLMDREEEFNKKKDLIGHLGFGEYFKDDKLRVSLVIYPNNDHFKVSLKYRPIPES